MTKKTRTIEATLSKCHMAPLDTIGCCMKCGEECNYKDIKFDVEEYRNPWVTWETTNNIFSGIGAGVVLFLFVMLFSKLLVFIFS